jgi:hypothetical protein
MKGRSSRRERAKEDLKSLGKPHSFGNEERSKEMRSRGEGNVTRGVSQMGP